MKRLVYSSKQVAEKTVMIEILVDEVFGPVAAGDIINISNLDEYHIEKIKDISRNIVTTTSMDGKVTYDLKNLEDVVGKIKIRINLSMIITFITTLSLGILYLIFDYYLLSKKDSKAN